ncbi:MAG: hypothetical protein KDA80_07685 [Planctomycetaceae bacterium]|nr:hypothetical protein [Planctomycetaceae bacterium]
MPRTSRSLLFAAALGVMTAGCTNLMARRAIERFSEGLQAQNLEQLKESSSKEFEQYALRQPEAIGDLKLLKVPTGEVEIVSVEKISEGEKKALVKIGKKDKAKELEYRLTLNDTTGRWVVDDVIMKQDSGIGMVERSVTEQMNLLLSCREFLDAWKGGSRNEKLAYCAPELKSELEKLPPTWLHKLAEQVIGGGRNRTYRPDARMNNDKAVVVVPHPDGDLFLECRQSGDQWQITDLAVEPTSEDSTGIRSARKMASALNRSAEFLTAYAAENLESLKNTASPDFFEKCLSGADLSEVELPVPTLLSEKYEARQFPDRVELLLHGPQTTYMLTLKQIERDLEDGTKGAAVTRIDDVTLFENDGKEVKRLSALFLTQSVVSLYLDALRGRDITELKQLSSPDFNERVWDRPEATHFAIMPDPQIEDAAPEVISTVFRGDVSEVTLAVGDLPMTIVLTASRGWMVVDDVIMPAVGRPTSLKQNLEVMLSLHSFAMACGKGDLAELIRYSGDGLDRIVWRQLDETPGLTSQIVRPLLSEVLTVEISDPWIKVITSDGITAAETHLMREGSQIVVHDVVLISEASPEHRVELMGTLREMIAIGEIGPLAKRRRDIQQARGEIVEDAPVIQHADFTPIERSLYTE